jgi:cation transport regulator ChaC
MTILYAAYGSCMSRDSLTADVDGPAFAGQGVIPGMELVFYSAATLEPAPGEAAKAAVWEIDDSQLAALDSREGYPNCYDRVTVEVDMADGRRLACLTYLMTEAHKRRTWEDLGTYDPGERRPRHGRAQYLEEVRQGYDEAGWGRDTLVVKIAPSPE